MTNPAFNPDDPRLTAFALGELPETEQAEIEQLIASSPEAAAAVKEIEETIGVLHGELTAEPIPELTDAQRSAILDENAAAGTERDKADSDTVKPVSKAVATTVMAGAVDADDVPRELLVSPGLRNFPWAIAGSLAASAAVLFAVVSWLPDGTGPMGDMAATPSAAESADYTDQRVARNQDSAITSLKEKFGYRADAGFAEESSPAAGDSFSEGASGPGSGSQKDGQLGGAGLAGASAAQVLLQKPADSPTASSSGHAARAAQPDPADRVRRESGAESGQSGQKNFAKGPFEVGKTSLEVARTSPSEKAESTPQSDTAPRQSERKLVDKSSNSPASQPASATPLPGSPAGKPRTVVTTGDPRGGVSRPANGEQRSGNHPGGGFAEPGGARGRELTDAERKQDRFASIPGRSGQGELEKSVPSPTDASDKLQAFSRGMATNAANEAYEPIIENDFIEPDTGLKRLSTFSIDVDTASYSNVRRFLNQGQVPPPNAVRIEELVNYFRYDYAEPEDGKPFAVDVELNSCPWATNHRLARIGIKARSVDKTKRPPTSLVFMIDVSGSMRASNKLALVKQAIGLLVGELTEDDQVAVVAYANNAGLRLDATSGSKQTEIMNVVNGLTAGGSTNGEGGIRTAYDTAVRHFIQGGSNRVIMCTDGDFNVGVNDDNQLVQLIEEKAASGVFLSIFGFGMGNLKDAKLEKLADRGNGHYGYMDNLREAQKVFRDELMGTLYTVAKDVKIQVEFNPATVGAYRLIGYENRKLAAQDFNDDTKDAGEIGAGHVVTALYEIVPKKTWDERPDVGELRYTNKKDESKKQAAEQLPFKDELLFVKLNYKNPNEETSTSNPGLNIPVTDLPFRGRTKAPSQDFMWAASVASFGMNLRGSQYRGSWTLADVLETAEGAKGDDDLRAEFAGLVKKAMSLIGPHPVLRRPEIPKTGLTPPAELDPAEARIKASVSNKYRRLLKKIEVPADLQSFGGFYDYGLWEGTSYAGYSDLPANGYWVYVSPHWYIWGEVVESTTSPDEGDTGDKTEAGSPGGEDPAGEPGPP